MERNQYVDVARGIAMICIVLGHLGNSGINHVVFTFHVTIFFLLTGYYMNTRASVGNFIKKKFRTLIIPYAVTCLAILILVVPFNILLNNGDGNLDRLKYYFMASLYGAGDSYQEPFTIYGIGAIWFLLATFWGAVVLRLLLNLSKIWLRVLLVIAIFAASYYSRSICWLPFSIQAGGCALLFMYIGYIGQRIVPAFKRSGTEIKVATFCLMLWLWVEFIVNFQSFWLVHCDIGRGAVDIIGSISACCCVLFISWLICLKPNFIANSLAYLGRYSLLVLSVHLVELDTFWWWNCAKMIFGSNITEAGYLWFRIIGKFIIIIPCVIILSKWKFSRRVFGYKTTE